MSEPRRWWVRVKSYDGSPVKRDKDRLCCDYEPEPQKLEAFVEVIEAEPVLARIKQLETQLKEANEVAEFYGDENNWEEVWMDFGGDDGRDGDVPARIDTDDCEILDDEHGMYFGSAGKRARAYLKRWEGEK